MLDYLETESLQNLYEAKFNVSRYVIDALQYKCGQLRECNEWTNYLLREQHGRWSSDEDWRYMEAIYSTMNIYIFENLQRYVDTTDVFLGCNDTLAMHSLSHYRDRLCPETVREAYKEMTSHDPDRERCITLFSFPELQDTQSHDG
jgi:hypothetical protein